MKGYRQIDKSVIWQDGSRTYSDGHSEPPNTYSYPPPNGVEIEMDYEPAQRAPFVPGPVVNVPDVPRSPVPDSPVVNMPPVAGVLMRGVIQGPSDVLSPELFDSTLWEDGSRDYPRKKGYATRPSDPPNTWTWPAPGKPVTKVVPPKPPLILDPRPPEPLPFVIETPTPVVQAPPAKRSSFAIAAAIVGGGALLLAAIAAVFSKPKHEVRP